MCLPLLIVGTLHWSVSTYNLIMLSTGLFCTLPCIYLMFYTLKDTTIYYISLPSVLAFALLQAIQIIWKLCVGSLPVNIFLSVMYGVLFTDVVLIRDIFVGSFLARMVPSRYQSTVDGIRLAVSRLGAVVAMSSSVYVLPYVEIVGTVLICCVVVFAVMLFVRRRTMMNPTVILS